VNNSTTEIKDKRQGGDKWLCLFVSPGAIIVLLDIDLVGCAGFIRKLMRASSKADDGL